MRTLLSFTVLALASAVVAQPNVRPGTNVSLSTLGSLGSPSGSSSRIGSYPTGQQAWGVSTTSCNVGTVNVPWIRDMNVDHPQMGMWMYREYNGRLEQISIFRGVKHGFTSTNSPGCGSCPGGAGTSLVIGCTDTYGASLNYSHTYMAPPSEIDPWTGIWTSVGSHFDRGYPVQNPPFNTDNVRSSISFSAPNQGYRNLVWDSELGQAGAAYWVSGYYNVIGEPDANRENNFATRSFSANWNGTSWSWSGSSGTHYPTPAIYRWSGASVASATNNGGSDGRFYVAVKVTGPVGGIYHYEYAVFNRDNNRQGGSFSIPVCSTASVTNLFFRDPDHTAGNDWSMTRNASEIVFTAPSGHVNDISWGNMYNFAFDSDASPAAANVAVGQANAGPGNPTVDVASQAPLNVRNLHLGVGCGTPTAPVLTANGPASLGNAGFALSMSGVANGSSCWFLLSGVPAAINLGGSCTLYINPAAPYFTAAATGSVLGIATLSLPVPNDPNLTDGILAVQALEIQTGGAYAGLIDLSSGLKVKLGTGNAGCN